MLRYSAGTISRLPSGPRRIQRQPPALENVLTAEFKWRRTEGARWRQWRGDFRVLESESDLLVNR